MMDTPEFELDIYVTFGKDTDLLQTAQIIEERLQQLPMVNEVEAAPEQLRMTGVEVVTAIAIVVVALRGSRQAVKELHELIRELRSLFQDLGGKDPSVNIGGRQIPLTGNEPTGAEITSIVNSWYKSRLLPPPERFDVCLVCALADEARACIEVISRECSVEFIDESHPVIGAYKYAAIANNKGEPLTVQVSWLPDYGLSKATIHIIHVLEQFKPLFVGMTGICAGDREKVRLGDIIVADRAFIYEMGKYVEGKSGQAEHLFDANPYYANVGLIQFARMFDGWKKDAAALPRPASKHQQRDWLLNRLLDHSTPRVHDVPLEEREQYAPDWRGIVNELRKDALLNEDLALLDKNRVYKLDGFPFRDPQKPECYIVPMASSHGVHSDNPFSEAQIPLRKTLAFDMEGAALYEVAASFSRTRPLVVKAVSDYGDKDKDDSYREYASAISSLYMLNLIRAYMLSERVQEIRKFIVNEHL